MTKDCYGTCPKCGEIGWCHYKGKARIFKSGPGSDLYKVSLFKCGNCGKKFGFELDDSTPEPKDDLYDMLEKLQNDYEEEDDAEEEKDDWNEIEALLYDTYHELGTFGYIDLFGARSKLIRALRITNKHCRCDS